MSITVTIPATIPAVITPNGSRKYPEVAKNRLRQELKATTIEACWGAGLHLGHDLTPPIRLHWTVAWGKGRKRMDPTNLIAALKWCEDGVAEVLNIDDRHFVEPAVEQIRDPDGLGFIRVEIQEIAA